MQSYAGGTVLFAPGDSASSFYFLLEGTVIATRAQEQIQLGAGAILGELAFFKKSPHFYGAICATEVKALQLNGANMNTIFRKQPRLAGSLLRELALSVPDEGVNPFFFFQGIEEKVPEEKPSWKDILPEDHPLFPERAPAAHNDYLFTVEVTCPICGTQFAGTRTRVSRLRAEEHHPDFRITYQDFDPNLYYVWVCPRCLFAYPQRQYSKISQGARGRGKSHFQKNPPPESFAFEAQRTLHQVFISYYLAVRTFEIVGAAPEQWANLWLRLVWLYEDLGEKDLLEKAAAKASHYFEEAMSKTARSAAGDQQIYIIMGELNLRLGQDGEAFRNFHRAATMRTGDPRYQRMAADRIQDLRRLREAEPQG